MIQKGYLRPVETPVWRIRKDARVMDIEIPLWHRFNGNGANHASARLLWRVAQRAWRSY